MTSILHISASPRCSSMSVSRQVASGLVDILRARFPTAALIERNLATDPIPAPDGQFAAASLKADAVRDATDRAALALSEMLITELDAADVVLISTAMHNFAMPASLKAWIDHVVRPARTFQSTPEGKKGLLRDRPVLLIATCGGSFGEGLGQQPDFLMPYMKAIFGVIGLKDFRAIRLENCARGEPHVEAALAKGRAWSEDQGQRFMICT